VRSTRTRSPRRRHLAIASVLCAAAVGLAACGSSDTGTATTGSSGLVPVKFQLSWLPGGDNLEFWAGQAQGIYKKHGIDIDIVHTNDPTLSIKAAATGQVPMAIAYTGDVLVSASKGEPVTMTYALTKSSPFGIISLKKSNIKTPKDLVGKTVGVTSLPIDQAEFKNMLETAGVNPDDVKTVDPGQGGIQQVIQGNLDATSAVADYEPAVLESQGINAYNFMYYSDYGAPDAPFYGIVGNPTWLKNNPDVMKNFLAATRESVAWTNDNTDEAVDIFHKQFPEQPKSLVKAIWQRESDIQGDGTVDPAKLEALEKFLRDSGQLTGKVNINDVYSNDFLPTG
jgi:ABC-type nitrate/sulfonate/bicarbonate transport system substrate-binding protein